VNHGTLAGIAAGLIAVAAGSWLVSLRLWPYKTCSWCDGTGRSPGSNSRRHGLCWRCKGTPRKLRRGARLFRGDQWGK
jgi:DnaJ-class molecular chaperone